MGKDFIQSPSRYLAQKTLILLLEVGEGGNRGSALWVLHLFLFLDTYCIHFRVSASWIEMECISIESNSQGSLLCFKTLP